jgi:membrane protease subunit (stomatin/prohibitin family)
MARIFDVIEYPNEMKDEIVHRFPETGIGDYRIGSQVIVRESQAAVFFRMGRRRIFGRAPYHYNGEHPLLVNSSASRSMTDALHSRVFSSR